MKSKMVTRMEINSPIFVLTSDVDWASDACIDDLAETAKQFGIHPVFMATGESQLLRQLRCAGDIELGVHPNFLPGSDHGDSIDSVIDYITSLFPQATTFRSHSFVDGTAISSKMHDRGFKYDSNLCLYLQANLEPLRHATGLMRFPVFWEDDVHWAMVDNWNLTDTLMNEFTTPGLKVLNVHPIHFALNTRDASTYRSIRGRQKILDKADVAKLRSGGAGTRSFVLELLDRVKSAGHKFYTLAEVYSSFSSKHTDPDSVAGAGRITIHTAQEHSAYWRADNQVRQQMLKEDYNERDALDIYATLRDHNLRELEIEALARVLPLGEILDLGCGNGYSIVSLLRRFPTRRMLGVDFSDKLIEEAKKLAESLDPAPQFICADAIEYLEAQADNTFDCIITERFLLNLPDQSAQHNVLEHIGRVLRPKGRLLMCEGSRDGFNALNNLRISVGLEAILETSADNMSALRFNDREIENFVQNCVGLEMIDKYGFSTFFEISRALHPKLAAPLKPRFSARINDVARELQMALPFKAGIGSNVLWVFEKRLKA
jgi:ubiquinone/menaquinone biosynthesis C-methylase UbiE